MTDARRHWCLLLAAAMLCAGGCGPSSREVAPVVAIVSVPEAGAGGSDRLAGISGTVTGARPGDRLVLFARSEIWWVQPFAAEPFTAIAPDATWSSSTHLGTEYAALLVEDGYQPPVTLEALPAVGGPVRAVAVVAGRGAGDVRPAKVLSFSGYDWEARANPSDRGGSNEYDPDNAWTDEQGHLHLAIVRRGDVWTSAEVSLTRPLGYGTYTFVVRDTSNLEPAATFGLLTWDPEGADQNHREIDIEISRWGDPAIANAQYVVQPYYVAANVFRFAAPAGRLTHAFRWEPGLASFRTVRGGDAAPGAPVVAQRDFTSGVPVPGSERVRLQLYFFRYSPTALQKGAEVVIEKFQYLP